MDPWDSYVTLPVWQRVLAFPFMAPILLICFILWWANGEFGPNPPGIYNNLNDPMWVRYNVASGEITSHPRGARGNDSDGSGMM
jgi:hypothetical protein